MLSTLNADAVTVDTEEEIFPGFETAEESRLTTNVYEEIRKRLVQQGIPLSAIAFIHDAKTVEQRNALFAAVNRGDIRILIGSTERMGTGMNVQERCLAVHHLVPPWRPSDIEQQLGRALRQGNLYRTIFQFVYVTKGSFDGYNWQLLENKAGFIAQVESGKVSAREMEDIGDRVMTMSEIKALASGNPLIMQKVVADSELTRLAAIYEGWESSNNKQHWTIRSLDAQKSDCLKAIDDFIEAIALRNASYTSDDDKKRFRVQLRRLHEETYVEFTDREAAGKHLRDLASLAAVTLKRHLAKEYVAVGMYRGLPLHSSVYQLKADLTPEPVVYIPVGKSRLMVNIGESDAGVTQSLDRKIRSLDGELQGLREKLAVTENRISSIEEELARPWDLQARYDEVKAIVDDLDKKLDQSQKEVQDAGDILMSKSLSLEPDDTDIELAAALEAIKAMHLDPSVLEQFGIGVEEPQASIVSPESLEANIQTEETLLAFGRAVLNPDAEGLANASQASWDDWLLQQMPSHTGARPATRRSKRPKASDGQLPMF